MSEILVNKLTGTSTAGDITVTSEGGLATMQLQQGLVKAWVNFDGSGAQDGSGNLTPRDSFNIASVTDLATGKFTPNFSNHFGSTNYIGLGANSGEHTHGRGMAGIGVSLANTGSSASQTTTGLEMVGMYGSSATSIGGSHDNKIGFVAYVGDLA